MVSSRSASGLVLALALATLGCVTNDAPTRPRADHFADDSSCADCHPAIVAEWRGSGHANAWTDPLVQREFASAGDASCPACHAPEAVDPEDLASAGARDGITCRQCHAPTAGRGLARAHRPGPDACADCHQFHFVPVPLAPGEIGYDPTAWLQDTVGEWTRSDAARRGVGCRDCHMRWIDEVGDVGELDGLGSGRHRDHRFTGMRDRELAARAVDVDVLARREGGTVIVDVTLTGAAIGHAFPTGDMFREGVLEVWTDEDDSDHGSERLVRSFRPVRRLDDEGEAEWINAEVDDTRVPPPGQGPRAFQFRLRSPAAQAVRWRLDLRAGSPNQHGGSVPTTRVAEGRVAIKFAPRDSSPSTRPATAGPGSR